MMDKNLRGEDLLRYYVELFNKNDEECYGNDIDNAHAFEWLRNEIPLFSCPDKDIERAYYFRWWTFRKHLKYTPDGYIITEFLPKVPWSGKHNEINAAAGHHIYEGRWLKNGRKYLSDYIRFFLDNPDRGHQYSAWIIEATWRLCEVNGDFDLGEDFLPKAIEYFEEWERTHGLPDGLFWSIDNYDAMEYSISGMGGERGIRPTLNSYMCAEAYAISHFATLKGDLELAERFKARGDEIREKINSRLFDDGFYRAYHYSVGDDISDIFERLKGRQPRELIGYIPWIFGIPEKGGESVFGLLDDATAFYSEQGLTTAERSHPMYLFAAKHECLWNGYVWPFATSQTLNALNAVIRHYSDSDEYKKLFVKLLRQYARSHNRIREDGTTVPWIDEVRHPERDEWSSRTILRDWGWREGKGGYERGKDYNHSTFCDLVISGLVGVSVSSTGEITVEPNVPEEWDYFTLDGVYIGGKRYSIEYRSGELKVEEIC